MKLLERIRARPAAAYDVVALEQLMRERYAFLESKGFERTSVKRFEDGVELTYRNRGREVGLRLFARHGQAAGHGVWGWVGRLDAAGRLRPLDRDTVDTGVWVDLGRQLDARDPGGGPLERRLAQFAEKIRDRCDRITPPDPRDV